MMFSGRCDSQFRQTVRDIHAKLMPKLLEHFPEQIKEITEKLEINLSLRLARTAGFARSLHSREHEGFSKHVITLHYRLLTDNPGELETTYAHELMHILANVVYGRVGHNWRWKNLMRLIGHSEERCHTMNTAAYARKRLRYVYGCSDCGRDYRVSKKRHKENGYRGWLMCHCRNRLELVFKDPVEV